MDASAVGHDLTRGTATFVRNQQVDAAVPADGPTPAAPSGEQVATDEVVPAGAGMDEMETGRSGSGQVVVPRDGSAAEEVTGTPVREPEVRGPGSKRRSTPLAKVA